MSLNDERAFLLNETVSGRIDPEDAARLLDALLELETGERIFVEPPCRVPPWREGDHDIYSLLWAKDASTLLSTSTYQIAKALRMANMDRASVHFAALETLELAEAWRSGAESKFTSGSMVLRERDGSVREEWIDIGVAAYSLALWLFHRPFPLSPTEERRLPDEEDEGVRTYVSALPEPRPVETGRGAFADVLRVAIRKESLHPSGRWEVAEETTAWLAPGVGPVRIRKEDADGAVKQADLSDARVRSDGTYFPRVPGNLWRFDSRWSGWERRERWRTLVHPDPGATWLIPCVYLEKGGDAPCL
jgi:hypothetical protein